MRTQLVVNQIVADAKIILAAKHQQIAKYIQYNSIEADVLEDAYEEFFAVENVLYALQFQGFLNLFSQNILCDFLIKRGYYFDDNSLFFTENIFNDLTFDTV